MRITEYSLKQWLMCIWVLLDQWRKHTPKKERTKQVAACILYALLIIVFLLSIKFWVIFFWSLQ